MVRRIAAALFAFFVAFAMPFSAFAEEEVFEEEYKTMISGIPDQILPYLPEEILSEDSDSIIEGAKKLSEPRAFIATLLNIVGYYGKDMLKMFARIIAIVLLSSVARTLLCGTGNEGVKKAFSVCSCAAMALYVVGEQGEVISSVKRFLEQLTVFVNSMIPIMGVLYAAGGNVSAAAAGTSSLSFFIAICENLCSAALIPIVGICLSFAMVSVFGGVSVSEISSSFKRIYTYGLGLLMSIMAIVMSLQNQLASKADSVGARTVKYALSSFIPIVGGAVGDSIRTVAAGIEYIRSAVGGVSVVIIILLLMPTLLTLFLGKAALDISSSLSKMLGCDTESRFLTEIGNVYGYMMATSSICSVLFIYALTLFVRCSAAAGG